MPYHDARLLVANWDPSDYTLDGPDALADARLLAWWWRLSETDPWVLRLTSFDRAGNRIDHEQLAEGGGADYNYKKAWVAVSREDVVWSIEPDLSESPLLSGAQVPACIVRRPIAAPGVVAARFQVLNPRDELLALAMDDAAGHLWVFWNRNYGWPEVAWPYTESWWVELDTATLAPIGSPARLHFGIDNNIPGHDQGWNIVHLDGSGPSGLGGSDYGEGCIVFDHWDGADPVFAMIGIPPDSWASGAHDALFRFTLAANGTLVDEIANIPGQTHIQRRLTGGWVIYAPAGDLTQDLDTVAEP